ncbi:MULTISPECIES: type IV secretory system conjugative DNA transfer family protein [Cytobacillus]|uniref:TraD/TraG TraM recognition site domain-containing protein n=4 Tax=Bacillati TaxID=1783272 RepID=A0A2N0ZN25_9BACI|nr:TraM recognition domain-containing protein [Cytobacillus horneckiae]MEC1157711.1 TraM recognition domain-containing protein [Cytobacillus horneckiae]PKG30903.1 hypothetical protein CWS20_01000 [Cytobacillus horneckiae]
MRFGLILVALIMRWVTKLLFGLVKLIVFIFGHLIKAILGKYMDFSNNSKNEDLTWNMNGVAYILLFSSYSVAAVFGFLRLYFGKADGLGDWILFFLSIPILLAFKQSAFIENMPLLRKEKEKIEQGERKIDYLSFLSLVIPFVTSMLAGSIIAMRILYPSYPTIALVIVAILFFGLLSYLAIRLTGLSAKEIVEQSLEEVNEGKVIEWSETEKKSSFDELSHIEEKELRELVRIQQSKEKADLDIIDTAQTKKQPRSARIAIPENSRLQHMQLLGPTGTGKSVLLLNMIIQDLTHPKVGLCVVEPFADLAYKAAVISKKIGRAYYYINPDYEFTHSFNPLDGDDINNIAEANAEAFVAGLGKETPVFYRDTQSEALVMAIRCLKEVKGDNATYFDIYDLLRPSGAGYRKKVMQQLEDKGKEALLIQLRDYHDTFANEKTEARGQQYYKGLFVYLSKITQNEKMAKIICQKSTFSIREAFDKGEVILVSTGFHVLGSQLSSTLGRLIAVLLKNEAFYRNKFEENEREKLPLIAMYMDEFQNYLFNATKQVFEMARKTRFSMCIAHQDLSQLRAESPELEKVIYNNSRQKIVYGGIDYDDCQLIAKQAGEEYREIKGTGVDKWNPFDIRHNFQEQKREIITGAQIYNLPAFNPVTFTPGKVFCKFVINNEQEIFDDGKGGLRNFFIGLVKPMFPKSFFKEEEGFILNEDLAKPSSDVNIHEKKEKVSSTPKKDITDLESYKKEEDEEIKIEQLLNEDINWENSEKIALNILETNDNKFDIHYNDIEIIQNDVFETEITEETSDYLSEDSVLPEELSREVEEFQLDDSNLNEMEELLLQEYQQELTSDTVEETNETNDDITKNKKETKVQEDKVAQSNKEQVDDSDFLEELFAETS